MPGRRPRVGELRHPVIVRRNRKIKDGRGGYETVETDVVTDYWISIDELSGKELAEYQTRSTKVTTLIKGRYHPDIDEKCWIVHGKKTYELEQVIDVEQRNIWLEILAYTRR